jgi:hypothetical protein
LHFQTAAKSRAAFTPQPLFSHQKREVGHPRGGVPGIFSGVRSTKWTRRFNNRKNPFLFRDTILKLIHSDNLEYKELTAAA